MIDDGLKVKEASVVPGRDAAPPPSSWRRTLRSLPFIRSRRRPSATTIILVAVTVVVGFLALTPLALLLQRTFTTPDGAWTLGNLSRAYQDPVAAGMLRNSFVFAVGSTAAAMAVGTTLAYLHARTDIGFKPLLLVVALVPLIIPGLLYAIAWILLGASGTGVLNAVSDSILGVRPFDIFSLPGMIWVEATNLAPLTFLLMLAAFRSMDPSLEESALISGAKGHAVLRRVTFPLVKPAFLSSALLVFVRAIESFEIPALLGVPGGVWVFSSRIWREISEFPADVGSAGSYATVLLLIASAGILLHNWYAQRGGEQSVQTIRGKAFRPQTRALRGKARAAANIFLWVYISSVVLLPLAGLVWASFLPFNMPPSRAAVDTLSLDNYRFVLESDLVRRGTMNSLILAGSTATTVMLLMAIAAWIVVRSKARGRWLLDGLAFTPMVLPGIVLGLAMLFLYLRVPLPIYGTLLILFIAYVTKWMPYAMRYASTSMYQIHVELEESAQVSGASWAQTFRRVILPLLVPGLLAGWIFVAVTSVRELSASLLIYSPGNEVLAVAMWSLFEEARTTELAALGVLLMIALMMVAAGSYWIGSRFGIRQDTTLRV